MKPIAVSVLVVFLLTCDLTASEPAKTMGEEHFGNKPLNALNFKTWPNVISVVNDKNRVYHQWVNGSEFCCYRGDTAALNAALQNFANVKSEKLEVVLRPGKGVATTFTKDKTVEFDWKLQLYGGIAGHMAKKHQGENIWTPHPTLFVRVTDQIELEQLDIPKNVSVLQISDLKQRYSKCLKSKDNNVRGWCCAHLADLNIYDKEIMNMIATRLEDEVDWVRLNALLSIDKFGNKAIEVSNRIKENLTSSNPQLRQQAEKALDNIASAKAESEAEENHNVTLKKINSYCERLRSSRSN